MICKAIEVIFKVQWDQVTCLGVRGGQWGSQGGGQGGHLGNPMGPWGWFVESPDDSWGIYPYKWSRFSLHMGGRGSEVAQEVLADLKKTTFNKPLHQRLVAGWIGKRDPTLELDHTIPNAQTARYPWQCPCCNLSKRKRWIWRKFVKAIQKSSGPTYF